MATTSARSAERGERNAAQSVTAFAGVGRSFSPPGTFSSSSLGRQSVPVPRIAPLPVFELDEGVGEGAGAPFG